MLWLNPATGDLLEAPKRPSASWVVVVETELDGYLTVSTLEGLRRAILSSQSYGIRPNDIEFVSPTQLNVYANEDIWQDLITDEKFPYVTMLRESDGTLKITYDAKSKDVAPEDEGISVKERFDDDDTPLKRGGQRGTGRSGGGQSGGGQGMDGGQGDADGDGEGEGEGDSDSQGEGQGEGEGEGDGEGEGEDRDAYQEGQDNAESVSDKLKEKMKDRMEGKGKPADESGEASGPAPDGSEGGAPAENPTGEGGQGDGDSQGGQGQGDSDSGSGQGDGGDGDSGDSQEQGEGGADGGGQGQGDGDTDGSGQEGNCDNCSGEGCEDAECPFPEEGSQDGDSDSQDGDGGDSSDSDSNTGTADSNTDENGEKGDQSGDSSEKGDSDGDESGQGDTPSLPPEDEDALSQCVEEAEDGRDAAEQSMQEANGEEARENAENARRAADEAREIVEQNGQDPDENEKVQEAEEYADEAEEFADLAEELEEEIRELFDESGLEEEDFEEFKQGLLDELFGEDGEFSDALTEQEKRLLRKIERRVKAKRGTIRCVNWETGEIKSFPENEEIGDTWIQITKFFSPFETANGKQIVVDRTIAGAVQMADALGIQSQSDKEEAKFDSDDADFVDALKKMRMFQVRSSNGKTTITY